MARIWPPMKPSDEGKSLDDTAAERAAQEKADKAAADAQEAARQKAIADAADTNKG